MASPSEAEVLDRWGKLTIAYHNLKSAFALTSTTNWITREDNYVQALESNYPAEALDPIRTTRSLLDQALLSYGQALAPVMRDYADIIGAPESDTRTIIGRRLYDWFIANSKTIKSRGFSYGSIAATGGNVGTGTINRLTVDENNLAIEACFPEVKTMKVVSDQSTGVNKHEEVFQFRGAARARDSLLPTGSGFSTNVAAVSAASTVFLNPSFSDYSGTSITALTDLTNWTVAGAIASTLNLDQTNYYRSFPGDTTPAALKFVANESISQKLSVGGRSLDPTTPYYTQIAVNREVGTGDGTITLTLGSKSATFVAAAQTGWNILRLAIGTNNWYKNFYGNDLTLTIALSGRTTGSMLVDDLICVPYTNFDGLWYCPVGSPTPFMRDDSFTFTDSIATDSVLQQWLWRSYGVYLPHTGSPTIADPT